MSAGDGTETQNQARAGWRFRIGVSMVIGGYVPLTFVPMVAATNFALGFKSALASLLALVPPLSKVGAVAVMGKPGFTHLKELATRYLRHLRPAQQVSRRRHRIGLVLFFTPILGAWLDPYAPGFFIDWDENEIMWSLIGDASLICGLFLLGGDFWDKLAALFVYEAKPSPPGRDGG